MFMTYLNFAGTGSQISSPPISNGVIEWSFTKNHIEFEWGSKLSRISSESLGCPAPLCHWFCVVSSFVTAQDCEVWSSRPCNGGLWSNTSCVNCNICMNDWIISGCFHYRGHQSFSCGSNVVSTIALPLQCQVLRTQLHACRNTPRGYSVARQHGNISNNKLSRHLVGTVMSHWQPLDLCQCGHLGRNLKAVIKIFFSCRRDDMIWYDMIWYDMTWF